MCDSYRNMTAKPATLAIPTTMICCTAAAGAPFSSLSAMSVAEAPTDESVPVEAEVAAAGAVCEVSVTPSQFWMHFFMVSYAVELVRSSG